VRRKQTIRSLVGLAEGFLDLECYLPSLERAVVAAVVAANSADATTVGKISVVEVGFLTSAVGVRADIKHNVGHENRLNLAPMRVKNACELPGSCAIRCGPGSGVIKLNGLIDKVTQAIMHDFSQVRRSNVAEKTERVDDVEVACRVFASLFLQESLPGLLLGGQLLDPKRNIGLAHVREWKAFLEVAFEGGKLVRKPLDLIEALVGVRRFGRLAEQRQDFPKGGVLCTVHAK
jgi:hypothetical protein